MFEVGIKHIVTLLSLVAFFFLIGYCKQEYPEEDIENKNLTFLEKNVCLNKKSYLSVIALLFLFAIMVDMISKKSSKIKETKKVKTL